MCLCARDQAEGQNWLLVIFRSSCGTAFKTVTLLYWTSQHGLRKSSNNGYNPQMQVKAVPYRDEAMCEHHPKKWSEMKMRDCSMIKRIKIWNFGDHGCHVLLTKEVRDHPAIYQQAFQKPTSLMIWGCIGAYDVDTLHIRKSHRCWKAQRF